MRIRRIAAVAASAAVAGAGLTAGAAPAQAAGSFKITKTCTAYEYIERGTRKVPRFTARTTFYGYDYGSSVKITKIVNDPTSWAEARSFKSYGRVWSQTFNVTSSKTGTPVTAYVGLKVVPNGSTVELRTAGDLAYRVDPTCLNRLDVSSIRL